MKNKIILILIVVFLGFVIWWYSKDGSQTPEVLGSNFPGRDFIPVLNEMEKINIDTSILEDPAFLSLKDFSIPIIPEPIGRDNPFSRIEGGAKSTKKK